MLRSLVCLSLTWSIAVATAEVPGTVIRYTPASSKIYVGSPGITVLPDGAYLASCDEFGKGSTEHEYARSHVFRSEDRGETWSEVAVLDGLFWSSLFTHRGDAYLLGTTKHHGLVNIRRSADGGRTWTEPTHTGNGLITPEGQYHTAPVPVVYHNGRIWRAVEDASNGTKWGYRYSAMMMSAPEDADLLNASSWTFSNKLSRNANWLDADFKAFLEGNAVITPEGNIVNILRVQRESGTGATAAVCRVSADGRNIALDRFITLPGAAKKFSIRFDEKSQHYWALASVVAPNVKTGSGGRKAGGTRNTLALIRSADLENWDIRSILLYHKDVKNHGFQYPDWHFDGDDIIAAVRTAHDDDQGGAHNNHDANYLTFHRFETFRDLTMMDSVVSPASLGYTAQAESNE